MADPLSVVSCVISIATAAIQSSRTISTLINDIKEASSEIKSVSHDVLAFASIVSSLKLALEEKKIKDAVGGNNAMIEVIGNLRHPLENCEAALQALSSKLSNELECRKGGPFRATSINLKWALFAKNEAKDLQLRLEVTKATLIAALNSLTTLSSMHTLAAIREVPWRGPSPNINFAIGHSLGKSIYNVQGSKSSPERTTEMHQTLLGPEADIKNAQMPVCYNNKHGHNDGLDQPHDSYLTRIFLQLNHHDNQIRQLTSVLEQSQRREDEASRLLPEDETESSLDVFFDCVSISSDNDSVAALESFQTKMTGSPTPYFESSASFYPEEYTQDRLFDERIFVSAMIQSREDKRTQKYYIDFAYEPRKWRGVVVSVTLQTEWTQFLLPYSIIHIGFGMRKKLPVAIHETLSKLLPNLELFDSVTSIALPFYQNNSGGLVVYADEVEMAEDTTEVALSCDDLIMLDVDDLDCAQFLESEVVTQYQISSPYFAVWVGAQSCVERKAPFRSARPQGNSPYQEFCNDLKLSSSLRGCSGVIKFLGVVLDDSRRRLKSFLYEKFYTNLEAIFESVAQQQGIIPWQVREMWARQIVTTVSEVHKKGIAPILASSYMICLRADGSIIILPKSPRPSDVSNGHHAPELRELCQKKGLQETSKFRSDIFTLGLILWQLAEHQGNLSNFFCAKYSCMKRPRCACTAPHKDPIELPECSIGIPAYFGTMIKLCRARDPKARPSARQLIDSFPQEAVNKTPKPTAQAILQRFPPLRYSAVYCDDCGARIMQTYYPFHICVSGGFGLRP